MPSYRLLPLTLAAAAVLPVAQASAQTAANPIEIDDCAVIEGVTETTWFVLTDDLDCAAEDPASVSTPPTSSPCLETPAPREAAIDIRNNTGRVILDLNGRTLTGGPGRDDTAIRVFDSPNALIRGNGHTRTDSGTWGATIQSFETGIGVRDSSDVSISHSGVANGGMYIVGNDLGIHGSSADRLFINSLSVRDASRVGIAVEDSDAPRVRLVNVDSNGAIGLALYDSPNATISGASGRTQDNAYGLAIFEGSDNAQVTYWAAHRSAGDPGHRFHWAENEAQNNGDSNRPAAGIFVGAENVDLQNLRFNQTGPLNTCDVYTHPDVVAAPTVGASTVYRRGSSQPLMCTNEAPELLDLSCFDWTGTIGCQTSVQDADADAVTVTYTFLMLGPSGEGSVLARVEDDSDGFVTIQHLLAFGEVLRVDAVATDADAATSAVSSTLLSVPNSPPVLDSLECWVADAGSPSVPSSGLLQCSVLVNDFDGHSVGTMFVIEHNGQTHESWTGAFNYTPDPAGDHFVVVAEASDGFDTSTSFEFTLSQTP